jgi:pimeloyl-ACP methyl ester carboxylesterase
MSAGLAVHELRVGEPGGTPVVLLHAFPLDHRMWSDVAELMVGEPTVLAPDLPGFGSSPSGESLVGADGDATPSIEAMADAVAQALDARGVTRAVVGGLSMGGYVALALAERHPGLVAALALCDTKSTADADEARANRLRVASTVEADGTVDAVLGMRTTLVGATSRGTRADLVERVAGWIADQAPAGVAWAQRAMAARPDRTAVLATFEGPALVAVGAEDDLTPFAAAQHMAAALPGATLVEVPRAGHLSAVENPEPLAAALTQLRERTG